MNFEKRPKVRPESRIPFSVVSRVYNRKEGEYPTHYSTVYQPFTGVNDLSSIIHNLWFHTTPLTTKYVAVHKTAASATRLNTCVQNHNDCHVNRETTEHY